ncbi:MAG: valine--tRNA ligase [Candidatus Magasanikbacteria bacterium]
MTKLPKSFEPGKYEQEVYDKWEDSGYFNPDQCIEDGVSDEDKEPFSMMLPPPNVTGTLHMGHASMLALQDLMARYHRMQGRPTEWLPGTDHAAVATESKVEKKLIEEEGYERPKEEMGREEFMQELEEFAEESKSTIINQAKKMGSSLDWDRYAFTLDGQRNKAVKTVFKNMFDDGLIYRDYRTVNWSVKGQSTCSDDELEHESRTAKLYTFVYSNHWSEVDPETGDKIEEHENEKFPITIATTRPETKLGDTAIAVSPDGKWSEHIGKEYEVYDVGQEGHTLHLKVIASEEVDEEFGTGAVGITPAHSHTDYEIYKEQQRKDDPIDLIQIIEEDGKLNTQAGEKYAGLQIEQSREQFVEYLKKENLMQAEPQEVEQNVGTSDRFGDVVEVLPKLQWFVDVTKEFTLEESNIEGIEDGATVTLKELMQHVVEEDLIEILPNRFEKIYFNWIDNLRDWCISRQIWYGHRIPVWYCQQKGDSKCKDPIVSKKEVDQCPHCGGEVKQDSDTLDTWFSAGLWTFSTLGWPDNQKRDNWQDLDYFEKNDLERFHPTAVLETGYDIIFFWVARMILMSTYNIGEIPFETVYLHGLVNDEQGRKMSKSLGNVIDPLDMKEKYGADATRMSLLVGNTPGNDMKLSEEKIESMKHFSNKLWNISRFILLNIDKPKREVELPTVETYEDKWILSKLSSIVEQTTQDLEDFNFSTAGERLKDFTWSELADWYLEMAKVNETDEQVLNYILNVILKLWHPFIPFVTETLWQQTYGENEMLMTEEWPSFDYNSDAAVKIDKFKDIVTAVRDMKNDYNINKASKVTIELNEKGKSNQAAKEFDRHIETLAGVEEIEILEDANLDEQVTKYPLPEIGDIYLHLEGDIDVEQEIKKTKEEINDKKSYVKQLENKLNKEGFLNNAPDEVVEQEKDKYQEAKNKLEQLQQKLNSLK